MSENQGQHPLFAATSSRRTRKEVEILVPTAELCAIVGPLVVLNPLISIERTRAKTSENLTPSSDSAS